MDLDFFVFCFCAVADVLFVSFCFRVQTTLPSADWCPHSGLFHSQLHHHINEEQQESREQCEPCSSMFLHSFTHCKHAYVLHSANLFSADLVHINQLSLTIVNYVSHHH